VEDALRTVLYGVLPSLGITLLLVGLFGPRWTGLAAGIAAVAAWNLIGQQWPVWPHELWAGKGDGMQRFTWGLVVFGLVNAAAVRREFPAWAYVPPAAALSWAHAWFSLQTVRTNQKWKDAEILGWQVAAVLAFLCAFAPVRRALQMRPGKAMAWVLCAILVADSVLLVSTGSAKQGQLAGALAAVFGAAAGTALWRQGFSLDRSAALPFAAAHSGLLVVGFHLSYLPRDSALLAAAAPLALLLVGPASGGALAVVRFASSLLLALGALAGAVWIGGGLA
jgi:hypothetical protein